MRVVPDLAALITNPPVANVRNPRNGAVWTRDAWVNRCFARDALWPLIRGTPHILSRCVELAAAKMETKVSGAQKWNGTHFVRKRTWLQELGLRVQLGHPPGTVCPYREAAAHDFVLYDLSGVHELNVDFCGCRIGDDPPTERRIQLLRACWWPATITAPNTCATFRTLRLFQTLNCLGKLTAYDFLRGLEKCTNHDGLDKPPVRSPTGKMTILQ
jgi:hypothetical protein